MLPVGVTGQVQDFAAVEQPIHDRGPEVRVMEHFAPLLGSLVGSQEDVGRFWSVVQVAHCVPLFSYGDCCPRRIPYPPTNCCKILALVSKTTRQPPDNSTLLFEIPANTVCYFVGAIYNQATLLDCNVAELRHARRASGHGKPLTY